MRPVESEMTLANLPASGNENRRGLLHTTGRAFYVAVLAFMLCAPLVSLLPGWFGVPMDDFVLLGVGLLSYLPYLFLSVGIVIVAPAVQAWAIWRHHRTAKVAGRRLLIQWALLAAPMAANLAMHQVADWQTGRWLGQTPVVAQPVIEAINRYHARHGQYPSDLQTLVPEFLTSIPLSPFGIAFDYSLSDYGLYKQARLGVFPWGIAGFRDLHSGEIYGIEYLFYDPCSMRDCTRERPTAIPGAPKGWYYHG